VIEAIEEYKEVGGRWGSRSSWECCRRSRDTYES